MEKLKLTAFEFIGASGLPQLVRLKRLSTDTIVAHFGCMKWIGIDFQDPITFEDKSDLIIEGEGLGHSFWNGERPTWIEHFDQRNEAQRLSSILNAVQRELNRARLVQ